MNLIIFLGAGVSIKSGLPIVDELTKLILFGNYQQNEEKNFIRCSIPCSADEDTSLTSHIQVLLRHLYDYDKSFCKNAVYRGEPTYEDLYALCKTITLFHVGLADNSIPTSFVSEIEKIAGSILEGESVEARILSLGSLASEASRFMEAAVVGALQSNCIKGLNLILELANSPLVEQLNIVTLNHDTLVEQYLYQEGVNVVDGFGPPDGDVRWYDDNVYDSDISKVRLFKLHGSVNWREFTVKSKPALFHGSNIQDIRDGEKKQLKLNLRSPSFLTGINKAVFYQRGIYSDVHYRFHEMLRKCSLMLMSGYGWGDTAMNWRLDTWLDNDRANAIMLLHPRPTEIVERSPIVGSAYDYWIKNRQLLSIPKWLCDTSLSDVEEFLRADRFR